MSSKFEPAGRNCIRALHVERERERAMEGRNGNGGMHAWGSVGGIEERRFSVINSIDRRKRKAET